MATYSDGSTANSTASGATLDVTGIDAAVGDLLVLFAAADNAGTSGVSSTSTSVTDAAGNTWTNQAQTNRTVGAANDGSTLTVWTCLVTNALVAATITINFSPNTTCKAAGLQKAVPAAGCAMAIAAVGPGVTGSSTGRSSGAVSVALGQTMIGACAVEENATVTADSDTSNGNWSTALVSLANGGAAGTSQTLSIQRKTVTATGNQTYNTTTASSRDWALNYLLAYEATAGTLATTDAVDAGSVAATTASVGTLDTTDAADAGDIAATTVSIGTMATTEATDAAALAATTASVGAMDATGAADRARFIVPIFDDQAGTRASSIRILVQFDWPTEAVSRLWDGSGPFVDLDGNVWKGCTLADGIDDIEMAINGEAAALNVALMGVGAADADAVWLSYTDEEIVGAVVRIMIQPCDAQDQPVGDREVMFTGRIDNIIFDDAVTGDRPVSAITAEVTNRFTLRRLENGGVLSDTDQRARSAALNPEEEPDRFAERVPLLEDKTIAWPKWRS